MIIIIIEIKEQQLYSDSKSRISLELLVSNLLDLYSYDLYSILFNICQTQIVVHLSVQAVNSHQLGLRPGLQIYDA
jgi:hypothetical protein